MVTNRILFVFDLVDHPDFISKYILMYILISNKATVLILVLMNVLRFNHPVIVDL
jgi:hypothetical protein